MSSKGKILTTVFVSDPNWQRGQGCHLLVLFEACCALRQVAQLKEAEGAVDEEVAEEILALR